MLLKHALSFINVIPDSCGAHHSTVRHTDYTSDHPRQAGSSLLWLLTHGRFPTGERVFSFEVFWGGLGGNGETFAGDPLPCRLYDTDRLGFY